MIKILLVILMLLMLAIPSITNVSAQIPYAYSTATGINAATISHNINLPTIGEAAGGDFYIVCIDLNGNAGTIIIPNRFPNNWTIIQKGINSLTFVCMVHLWDQSDTSPIVVATGNSVQDAYVSVLIKGASIFYFPTNNPLTGNSVSPNVPSINISPIASSYIIEALAAGNNNFCDETAFSSGYNQIDVRQENGAVSATVALGFKSILAGKESPGPMTVSPSCNWVTMTFAFTNPQTQLFLSTETILLILVMISLAIVGFKIPLFWLFSALSGFFAAFFIYRDIISVPDSALFVIVSFVILFLFMARALTDKINFGD